MSTEFPEPKEPRWEVYDGWVFPETNFPHLRERRHQQVDRLKQLTTSETFEAQSGIFGQYRHFYGNLIITSLKKTCFKICLKPDSLATRNLNQGDKACIRECLANGNKLQQASNTFIIRQQSDIAKHDALIDANLKL
jgi:hypothetical protein